MKKVCCICKKPIKSIVYSVEIIPNELYADLDCIADLIPEANQHLLRWYSKPKENLSNEERKELRKIEIEKVTQKLIEEHKKD